MFHLETIGDAKISTTYQLSDVDLTFVKCTVKNIINHLQPFTNHLLTSYIKVCHVGLCVGPQKYGRNECIDGVMLDRLKDHFPH